jgi:uncharacterized protein YodC (DUF2158 family)
MGSAMLKLTKRAVIAATLGVALSAPWAVPALADPAQSNTAMQSDATPLLQSGDLVRLRSGGPFLTVKSVQGEYVICTWWSEEAGEFRSGGFPIAMVAGPVTLPPNDANPQTNGQLMNPTGRAARLNPAARTARRERYRAWGDPSGTGGTNQNSIAGTNQNSTAGGTNQTTVAGSVGQGRAGNTGTSTYPNVEVGYVCGLSAFSSTSACSRLR